VMKWTQEIPKVEGYYWYRKYPSWDAEIVLVSPHADFGLMQNGWEVAFSSHGGKAMWSDQPIQEPQEPTP